MAALYQNFVFLTSVDSFGEDILPDEIDSDAKFEACVDFMNFCLWLHEKILENVADHEEASAHYRENVVLEGWGSGIDDMDEVETYLREADTFDTSPFNSAPQQRSFVGRSGRPIWNDGDFARYKPSKYSPWNPRKAITAPVAFVNYMKAFSGQTDKFMKMIDNVAKEIELTSQSLRSKNWQTASEHMGKLTELWGNSKFLLQYYTDQVEFATLPARKMNVEDALAPLRHQALKDSGRLTKDLSQLESRVMTSTTWAGHLTALASACSAMVKLEGEADLDEAEAIGLGVVHFALNFLPLFGNVYQSAIESLCDFLPEYRKIVDRKRRVTDDVIKLLEEDQRRARERLNSLHGV